MKFRVWVAVAVAVTVALPTTIAGAAGGGQQIWASFYNGNTYDSANAVGVSPDGSRVFVTGYSGCCQNGKYYRYATVAYDAASGAQVWVSGPEPTSRPPCMGSRPALWE